MAQYGQHGYIRLNHVLNGEMPEVDASVDFTDKTSWMKVLVFTAA